MVKQITTFVREHHPVEKEFVVETRPTGNACMHQPLIESLVSNLVYLAKPFSDAACSTTRMC